jgi:hypothetical protein
MYNTPANMRNIFNDNWANRNFLIELIDSNAIESPKKGQGVLFIVADKEIGAVHSEPKINNNRLFFSVLVGSEPEIHELYSNWHAPELGKIN